MEGLLTTEIKSSLEKIISKCFFNNRIMDRMCSILSINFAMSNTSNILHKRLAHLYPVLADDVSDYMDARDCSVIYGATPVGDQEYESVLECFNKILELNLDLESEIKNSIKVANEINDYATKVFLENFLLKIISITKDILLLVDKAEMYGDSDINIMKLDHDIPDFGVFE